MVFSKFFGGTLFHIRLDTLIREIHRFGIFPILLKDFHKALDEVGIVKTNAEFTAFVKALGIDVEGAEQSTLFIGQDQLGVEVGSVEFVSPDAEILQQPETSYSIKAVEVT
jgi:hypothetical protein